MLLVAELDLGDLEPSGSAPSDSGSSGGNWLPPLSAGLIAGPFIGCAVPNCGRPPAPALPLRRPKALMLPAILVKKLETFPDAVVNKEETLTIA
jgi:hypothetical protein